MAHAFLKYRRIAQAGRKKESAARRRNPACQQCTKPLLTACHALHQCNALIADACSSITRQSFCQSSARVHVDNARYSPKCAKRYNVTIYQICHVNVIAQAFVPGDASFDIRTVPADFQYLKISINPRAWSGLPALRAKISQ